MCMALMDDGQPCGQIKSMGSKRSPAPLNSHLRRIHKITVKSQKEVTEDSEGDSTEPKRTKVEPLQVMVSRLAAVDGLPFNVIAKSSTIRQLFSNYGHSVPLSPDSVRELVLKEANEIREEFKSSFNALKDKGRRFNFTMDEWTSTAGRRYANVNVHCEGRVFCLGLKRCLGSMSSAIIRNILQEHGLEEQDVVAITTDGATGKALPFIHQLCIAQGLHLAVADVLYSGNSAATREEIDGLNDPDENDHLVTASSSAVPESSSDVGGSFEMGIEEGGEEENFTERFQIKELIDKVRNVVDDFKHRPVRMFSLDVDLPGLSLTDLETSSLRVISNGLDIVKDTLKFLCSRDNSNSLLSMDAALTFMLNSMETDSPFGGALYEATVRRVNERRTIASSALQYLHHGGANDIHHSFKSHSVAEVERFILLTWNRLHGQGDIEDVETQGSDCGIETADNYMDKLRRAVKDQCEEVAQDQSGRGGTSEELKTELKLFRKNRIRGAKLEFLYTNMKSIQVTSSVGLEKSFSVAGTARYGNKLRSSLSDESLYALTMMRSHFEGMNKE